MSVFDADKFMDQGISEAGSTKMEPIPDGEYPAIIDDAVVHPPKSADHSPRLEVTYSLQAPQVAERLGRQKLTVRQSIFLDTTSNGGLDMAKGRNIQLNRLREALDLNKPGKEFKLNNLKGAGPLKVVIGQRQDKNALDVFYTDVKAVGKM